MLNSNGIARYILMLILAVLAIMFFMLPHPPDDASIKAVISPDKGVIRYEPFVLGFKNPWGMVFLPSGEILVTEKQGSIRIIQNGRLLNETLQGVPDVYVHGQGGLLDIALHPEFSSNSLIYLTYAAGGDADKGGNTALFRAKLQGRRLTESKVLYKAEPNTEAGVHFGSRIAFDKFGYIYFSIGDRGERDKNPQDISRDGGKIYRLHDDGRVPEDNPFAAHPGAKKAVYSYGHRNPQGLALNPFTGTLFEHEHGPQGGDELNIIKKGRNYGWPKITYGINYSGTPITKHSALPGLEQPKSYWTPSIAPCGMTFISSSRYPKWKGDLIVASLKFGYLVRIDMQGDTVGPQERIAEGLGRVRNVKQGLDGYLYAAVEGKGLYRLMPQ